MLFEPEFTHHSNKYTRLIFNDDIEKYNSRSFNCEYKMYCIEFKEDISPIKYITLFEDNYKSLLKYLKDNNFKYEVKYGLLNYTT